MRVSAIVSAYFAENFIQGRIENLLSQSENPEVIVVCRNGSREKQAAENYPVRILPTDGIPTVYAAWNLGAKAANGKYLTNANCDDRLYPGALKLMADYLDGHGAISILYGWSDIVKQIGGDPINRYEWIEGDFEVLRKGCFIGPMPMWRKELHKKYGYFDEDMRSAGDYEFWLRVTSKGERVRCLRRALGAYCRRSDSVERRENLRSLWEAARARSRYVPYPFGSYLENHEQKKLYKTA